MKSIINNLHEINTFRNLISFVLKTKTDERFSLVDGMSERVAIGGTDQTNDMMIYHASGRGEGRYDDLSYKERVR